MSRLPLLSVCMIVKNEEQFIENCLKSMQNIADELIVVDTGCTDRTVEIAQSFGARIFPFSWNRNFSDARNYSLKQATGEWLLILDADEELHRDDRRKLIELISDRTRTADAYWTKLYNYVGTGKETEKLLDGRVSVFRNGKGFCFQGGLHENILTSIQEKAARLELSDIRILHYGYLDEVIKKKNKSKRNREVIDRQRKQTPEDDMLRYYLAVEYLQVADYAKSSEMLLELAQMWTPEHSNYSDVLHKLCISLREQKELETCQKWLETGIRLFPDFTDLYFTKGMVETGLEDWKKAEHSFQACLSLGDPPFRYYSLDGVGTYRAWHALGFVYEIQDLTEQALAAYLYSLQHSIHYEQAFCSCMNCAVRTMDPWQFAQFADIYFDLVNPDTFHKIGKSLIRFNRFDYFLILAKKEKIFHKQENFFHFAKLCESMYNKVLQSKK